MSQVTSTLDPHEGFKNGLSVEHIMLSVTVVSSNKICQYDDTCAGIIERTLNEYGGVKSVRANVLYKHTKIEPHSDNCQCGECTYTMEDQVCPQ